MDILKMITNLWTVMNLLNVLLLMDMNRQMKLIVLKVQPRTVRRIVRCLKARTNRPL